MAENADAMIVNCCLSFHRASKMLTSFLTSDIREALEARRNSESGVLNDCLRCSLALSCREDVMSMVKRLSS